MLVRHPCPHEPDIKDCGTVATRDACNAVSDTVAYMQVQVSRWKLASMPEDTSSSTTTEGFVNMLEQYFDVEKLAEHRAQPVQDGVCLSSPLQ